MALSTRLSLLAIGILSATAASAQHVLLPFSQHEDISLSARASEEGTLKSASGYAYVIDATVGTPPQKVSLLLSTSSGDTWVPDANTMECSPEWYYRSYYSSYGDDEDYGYDIPKPECLWGSFNNSLSSTYLPANSRYLDFSVSYIDSNYVSGLNMTDSLTFGDIELNDYPMGLVSSASRWIGMLGLGYNSSSNYYSSSTAGQYANVMDRMVSSGKIASPAYSIWLDNAKGSSGGILFGAVDRSRYSGDLVRVSSRYSSYSYYPYGFSVVLNSINGTTASGSPMAPIRTNDFPLDVTVGAGEVYSFLPESLAEQIAGMTGATFNDSMESYEIPCDAGKKNNTKLVFEIGGTGGPKLHVETADLVVPSTVNRFRYSSDLDPGMCMFAIQAYDSSSSSYSTSSNNLYNLGGAILRRSYVVYDLANQEIAVAPVKFSDGGRDPTPEITAFESYGAYVPSASEFCTNSFCPSDSGSGSGSDYNYGPNRGSGNFGEPGFEHWKKVAIGVGVGFGVIAIVAAVAGIIVCKRSVRGTGVAKEVDEEGLDGNTPPATSTNPPVTQNPTSGAVTLPPRSLPIIEEASRPNTQPEAQAQAPQLPALETRPITPPEPTASANSNRQSVAVSALSAEQEPQTQEHNGAMSGTDAAAPPSPKGKGKEVDHDEN
ncbi:aspartic peptidase domain-containing protein [Corynascus novoguineensis]|uniref:Aspartic peptidase domain-containing protein n=1 Tax=Corynascus novoguineensis TaxID=1126955 RepID=A0AAN7CRD8_9PEZI|nr:aspartic peptidase domain-containing protein [Corynascus novoguineensis]